MQSNKFEKLLEIAAKLDPAKLDTLMKSASEEVKREQSVAKVQLDRQALIPKSQWTYLDFEELRAQGEVVHDFREYSHLFQPLVPTDKEGKELIFHAERRNPDGFVVDMSGPVVIWDQQAPPVDFPAKTVNTFFDREKRKWVRVVRDETEPTLPNLWSRDKDGVAKPINWRQEELQGLENTPKMIRHSNPRGRKSVRREAMVQAIQQDRWEHNPNREMYELLAEAVEIKERAQLALQQINKIKQERLEEKLANLTEEERNEFLGAIAYQEAEQEWLHDLKVKLEKHQRWMAFASEYDEDYDTESAKSYETYLLQTIASGFRVEFQKRQKQQYNPPMQVKLEIISSYTEKREKLTRKLTQFNKWCRKQIKKNLQKAQDDLLAMASKVERMPVLETNEGLHMRECPELFVQPMINRNFDLTRKQGKSGCDGVRYRGQASMKPAPNLKALLS